MIIIIITIKRTSLLSSHVFQAQDSALIFLHQLPCSRPWCCSALEVIRTSEFHYLDADEGERAWRDYFKRDTKLPD
jgi:hypothetical protein